MSKTLTTLAVPVVSRLSALRLIPLVGEIMFGRSALSVSGSGFAGVLAVVAVLFGFSATPAFADGSADRCPNASLRVGASANLPDCRAYELVSPDSNHAQIVAGQASAGGDMMVYQAIDAPQNANSGLAAANFVRSTRNSVTGWSGASLTPPLVAPVTVYAHTAERAISYDLSSTLVFTDQPLAGSSTPLGVNAFFGDVTGRYTLMTAIGTLVSRFNSYQLGNLIGATPDFSHLYFTTAVAQSPGDVSDLSGSFVYGWSKDQGLRPMAVLPDGTPALDGGVFRGISDDGRLVAFDSGGRLYLRPGEGQTVDVGAIAIDPGNQRTTDQALLTSGGSKLLFTSRSLQTPDANPVGKDLYSYDTVTGELSDLTVDSNPADAGTGAEVRRLLGASADGSFIYFVAAGALAPGARAGESSLYVWHEGKTDFIAKADGAFLADGTPRRSYLTPDGRHFAFVSTDNLTGYDTTDPQTGTPHTEVYVFSVGGDVACASCRGDGTRPTGDSTLEPATAVGELTGAMRVVSDDGVRTFFQSTDAVVPQASNGSAKVYEYSGGRAWPISPVDGTTRAGLVGVSASGDDVFFVSHDRLVPGINAGDSAVFDARVGGGFPVSESTRCSSGTCRESGSAPAVTPQAVTLALSGSDNAEPVAKKVAKKKKQVVKKKVVKCKKGFVRKSVKGSQRCVRKSKAGATAHRVSRGSEKS